MFRMTRSFLVPLAMACLALTGFPLRAAPEAARPVTVTQPVSEPIVSVWELTGSVIPRRQSRLSARTSGLIHRIGVEAGDIVTAGDVLMELDPALATFTLEKTMAARQQAELELAEAERLLTEGRNLAKVGGFSQSEAETRETLVQVNRTRLQGLSVDVQEQEEMVRRHQLPAPFAGVISQKLAEIGEWVQTGTPVLELVETTTPWLDVQAPQEAYGTLFDDSDGTRASHLEIVVRLDPFPDIPLKAQVATRVPVKDPAARTFLVRLELDDPNGLASPGMSGRVRFSRRGEHPVLQIDRDAIVRFPDGSAKVWVVESGNGVTVARPRTVEIGATLTSRIEVRAGLDAADTVVRRGNEGLRDGQPLRVVADTSSSPTPPPAPAPPR